MSLSNRTERLWRPRRSVLLHAGLESLVIAGLLPSIGMAAARTSPDHVGLPLLTLPVAPNMTAVTPDSELVGIASGVQRSIMLRNG